MVDESATREKKYGRQLGETTKASTATGLWPNFATQWLQRDAAGLIDFVTKPMMTHFSEVWWIS